MDILLLGWVTRVEAHVAAEIRADEVSRAQRTANISALQTRRDIFRHVAVVSPVRISSLLLRQHKQELLYEVSRPVEASLA